MNQTAKSTYLQKMQHATLVVLLDIWAQLLVWNNVLSTSGAKSLTVATMHQILADSQVYQRVFALMVCSWFTPRWTLQEQTMLVVSLDITMATHTSHVPQSCTQPTLMKEVWMQMAMAWLKEKKLSPAQLVDKLSQMKT